MGTGYLGDWRERGAGTGNGGALHRARMLVTFKGCRSVGAVIRLGGFLTLGSSLAMSSLGWEDKWSY